MKLLTLVFVFVVACGVAGRAHAQPLPKVKFKSKAQDNSAANKDVAEKVAKELEELTGYNFTSDGTDGRRKSEGREMIDRGARNMADGSDPQVQHWLVEPMLGFYAMMDPDKAFNSEITFWERRGWGFPAKDVADARQTMSDVRANAGADGGLSRQDGFKAASDRLIGAAVKPDIMAVYNASLSAYRNGQLMQKQYDRDSDNDTYRVAKSLRDANLSTLGFTNKDRAVMGMPMGPPQIVPAEGGFKQRNISMFLGLSAAFLCQAVQKGVVKNAPSVDELKKAMATDDAGWGFDQLDKFVSKAPASLAGRLQPQCGAPAQP